VETGSGRVYVSYFDQDRTDGLNIVVHDPDMGDGGGNILPPAIRFGIWRYRGYRIGFFSMDYW